MYIDSHCHYDLANFNADREALLKTMKLAGIGAVVVPAILAESNINMRTKLDAFCSSDAYPKIYYAAGIHPTRVWKNGEMCDATRMKFILDAVNKEGTVAVGETGLDYHLPYITDALIEKERFWFEFQLCLAEERSLPLILHIRDAAKDALAILSSHNLANGGVAHCFDGDMAEAERYLSLGLHLGIGGAIFSSDALCEVVAKAPLDRLLLETDAPFMKPTWDMHKVNTSLNLPKIAERIAELRQTDLETVEHQTTENAKKLFHIG